MVGKFGSKCHPLHLCVRKTHKTHTKKVSYPVPTPLINTQSNTARQQEDHGSWRCEQDTNSTMGDLGWGCAQSREYWGFMQGWLVRLPPTGCWDTTDREGKDVSREERLDRGRTVRSGHPPTTGQPHWYGAIPVATIQGRSVLSRRLVCKTHKIRVRKGLSASDPPFCLRVWVTAETGMRLACSSAKTPSQTDH